MMAAPAQPDPRAALAIFFEDFALDIERRELRRAGETVSVEPQVFDLLTRDEVQRFFGRRAVADLEPLWD